MSDDDGRRSYLHSRIAEIAKETGNPSVCGMLMWYDPSGEPWIAPLGSSDPAGEGYPSAAWIPIKILRRTDRL